MGERYPLHGSDEPLNSPCRTSEDVALSTPIRKGTQGNILGISGCRNVGFRQFRFEVSSLRIPLLHRIIYLSPPGSRIAGQGQTARVQTELTAVSVRRHSHSAVQHLPPPRPARGSCQKDDHHCGPRSKKFRETFPPRFVVAVELGNSSPIGGQLENANSHPAIEQFVWPRVPTAKPWPAASY